MGRDESSSPDRRIAREYGKLWENSGAPLSVPPDKLPTRARKAKGPAKTKVLATEPKVAKAPVPVPVAPPASDELRSLASLSALRAHIGDCRRCKLCSTRDQIVFGDGPPKARLMFVGEGPGADEDKSGHPFVGRAGQLLTKIIEAMGLKREEVYIANVVKCRPPGNRQPEPDESGACGGFLETQIRLVNPEIVVALGATATQYLLQRETAMGPVRGRFHPLPMDEKRKLLPTYHPAYLLRNPPAKKFVWDDMKVVMAALGLSTGKTL